MTVVEREIIIGAPADEIAAYAEDNSRVSEWYAGISESNPSSDWPEVGATSSQVYNAAGAKFSMTLRVTDYQHAKLLAFDMDGMIKGNSRWEFIPVEDGTRVRVIFDYTMPGGGLGKIADKLVVERMNTSNLEKSLENLKAYFEG
jgi:uncharacterized membrane protein